MAVQVKIINHSNNQLPEYKTNGSSGMDLRAFLSEEILLQPFERKIIPTELYIELPPGYEGQIRPRSGLAVEHGITVLNSPGSIDQDFRGQIQVILINLSDTSFTVESGMRIAQLVIAPVEQIEWELVDHLTETVRGEGGFGHTGKL